jgi:hypothetical protein
MCTIEYPKIKPTTAEFIEKNKTSVQDSPVIYKTTHYWDVMRVTSSAKINM